MRTTWNGSVSFGLVNIPVGLAPATAPAARQSDVSFRMLHRECQTPIKQKRWCPVHDREVGPDEIVSGWEVAKGQFVIVEDAELEAIEQHDTSRASRSAASSSSRRSTRSTSTARTSSCRPAPRPRAGRTSLLLEAMKASGVAALGRFVLAGKEKLCLIRPKGEALALETLFVAEDVKDQAEIDEAVAGAEVKKPELELARQIIDALEAPFDPAELRSEYREPLRELLEAKLAGQRARARREPEPAPVVDLMEALRASRRGGVGEAAGREEEEAPPRRAKRAAASK